jgi:hypothetical protein
MRRQELLRQQQEEAARQRELQDKAAQEQQLRAQETQIKELLERARRQLDAGSLSQPVGASAADSYRAILKLQPERPEALAGARRIASILAAEADNAEAAGDVVSAGQLLEQIESLQPALSQLPQLQARLQQLQATPINVSSRERSRLEKAARAIARAQEDLDRAATDSKAADRATNEYDRAVSASPRSPGLPSLKERLISAYADAVRTELGNNEVRSAARLIKMARRRGFVSEELMQLEAGLNSPPEERAVQAAEL